MKYVIEALIYSCIYAVFMIVFMTKQGAVRQLHNYPPKIQERAIELGITTREQMAADSKKYKPLGFAVMLIICMVIICIVNKETRFWAGFFQAYLFLNAWSFFDAAVFDSLWFCRGKFWVIPGTEDMTEAYHDCWFHWKWFFLGLIAEIPLCIVVGGLTALFALL